MIFQHPPRATKNLGRVLAKAQAGDHAAQFQAALAFETGTGAKQDYGEAVKWYQKAADQGDAAAQNNLGAMYLRGMGVAQSDVDALRWYLRAAVEGYPAAQTNVGFLNAAGRGTHQNDEDAVRWCRKAAEKGYAPAQSNLAFMYSEGRGLRRDGNEAVRWSRKATAQNYAPAEYKLGLLYMAAEHGSAAAENEIGRAYQYGQGVPQSDMEALKWYRKGSDHGLLEARHSLEVLQSKWQQSARAASNPSLQPIANSAEQGEEFAGTALRK